MTASGTDSRRTGGLAPMLTITSQQCVQPTQPCSTGRHALYDRPSVKWVPGAFSHRR